MGRLGGREAEVATEGRLVGRHDVHDDEDDDTPKRCRKRTALQNIRGRAGWQWRMFGVGRIWTGGVSDRDNAQASKN